jgi:large subunit ribosomal protein L24
MLRIRKNDRVMVIAGKDRGKIGKVLEVFPTDDRVLVETINKVKKAQRKTQQNQKGGFVDIERPIHISNVMLVDKKTNKPTRFKVSILKDGTKVRISKKSGEVI